MDLCDKIVSDVIKASKDANISSSAKELLKQKSDSFISSGLDSVISGIDSFFNSIKGLIGKFSPNLPNSKNIVKENSENFYDEALEGFEEPPEDLI